MSAVIAIRGENSFIVGHDSCVARNHQCRSESSVSKLAVWPTFAIGYVGDLRIPRWVAKQKPLRRIADLLMWEAPPSDFNGFRMVIMFPDGHMHAAMRGYWSVWRGRDAFLEQVRAEDSADRATVGCWNGALGDIRACRASVQAHLRMGTNSVVLAPFRTFELPFGDTFPGPYGLRRP